MSKRDRPTLKKYFRHGALPTSERRLKFCMLRAPTWITSAISTTASTSRGSINSVTSGSPVSSRASARMCSASTPSPWKAYGDVRGLNAPPRRAVAPASLTSLAQRRSCSRDSTEQGPAIMQTFLPPTDAPSVPPRAMTERSFFISREAIL